MKPSRPSIAAIIAARDSQDTIQAAISSLLNQTIVPDEIVLVSDGSVDDTADLAAELIGDRGMVIRLPESVGRGAARNIAAGSTNAKMLLVCDADDTSIATRVENLLAGYFASGAQITGGQAHTCTPRGKCYGRTYMPLEASECHRLATAGNMPIVHPSCLVDHDVFDAVGGYEPSLLRAQDLHFVIRVARAGGVIVNVPEVVLEYTYPRLIGLRRYQDEQGWANVARETLGIAPAATPNISRWLRWSMTRVARDVRQSMRRAQSEERGRPAC